MSLPRTHESALHELHRSLDERWRPEDVAQQVRSLLDLSRAERRTLNRALDAARQNFWFSMSTDFHRPVGMGRQLSVAQMMAETIRRMAQGESVSSMYVD